MISRGPSSGLTNYYGQVGRNLAVYSSRHRLQRARGLSKGWFSNIIYGSLLPLITGGAKQAFSHIGKQALTATADVANDLLAGKNIQNALPERLQERVDDTFKSIKAKVQKGSGNSQYKPLLDDSPEPEKKKRTSKLLTRAKKTAQKATHNSRKHLQIKKKLLKLL